MIHINELSLKVAAQKQAIVEVLGKVLDSGWFILGPEVVNFEKKFADYLKIKYCVTVANGTDAIELALKGLNISKGDSVATVANAGMYTTIAINAIGACPVFMDVDINSRCVGLNEVIRAVELGVKAVVVTHLYGQIVPEIENIVAYCLEKEIPVLEDCAQAHGAVLNDKQAGTFGTIASFSFYPTKNLGALGDGGAVVTNSEFIAEKIKCLRQYGWTMKYKSEYCGGRNSRLDEMQAAILNLLLDDLDRLNWQRRKIASKYAAKIMNPHVLPYVFKDQDYVAHLYVIRTKTRDDLQAYLKKHNIGSEIHYGIPDYKQPIFKQEFSDCSLKNTEQLCKEILTIPCYPELTDTQVDYIINTINNFEL